MDLRAISLGLLPVFLFGLGLLIGRYVVGWSRKQQSDALRRKFASLGDLKGKTRAEIERVVGPPRSWAVISNNKISANWRVKRYHITLLFDGDICQGVTSEFSKFSR